MGLPISLLDPVELPLKESDLIEVSRERVNEPGLYDSYKCPAYVMSVVQATTTIKGIMEFATDAEAIEGTDEERGITPAALEAAIVNFLQNRIVAGDGITLSYDAGTGILTISGA